MVTGQDYTVMTYKKKGMYTHSVFKSPVAYVIKIYTIRVCTKSAVLYVLYLGVQVVQKKCSFS